MPSRSFLIASTRSSRSVVSEVCWVSTSRSSSSARRLTAPSRSRSRRSRSSFSSISARSGSTSRRLDLGERGDRRPARPPACRGFRGRCRRAGAWRLRSAPRRAPSPRARRWRLRARRGRRGRPRPARSRPLAAGRRRRAARPRRLATSLISAARFSAKTCGAFSSSVRSRLASAMRCSSVAIWVRAPSRALGPAGLVGGERRQPAVGQFGFAHDRLLLGAHLGERGRACRRCRRARRRACSRDRRRAPARRARVRPRFWPAAASSRLALSRARASASAESRAAWRLRSRSRVRVSVSVAPAASKAACAASSVRRLPSTSARAPVNSASISAKRLRCARRRAAPVGACAAATKPSQRHRSPSRDTSRWPVLSAAASGAAASRSTTPIWARRRASCAGACTKLASGVAPAGKAGSAAVGFHLAPVHGRGRIDRRVEIVAERGAERLLVALLDRDAVDHRRPQAAGLERQHLRERLRLGFQPLHALFGLGERGARRFEFGAGGVVRGFGGDRGGFGLGQRRLRAFDRGGKRRAGAAVQRRQFALDGGDFAGDARDALVLLARGVLEAAALRGQVGERGGQLAENLFGGGKLAVGLRDLGVDAAAAAGALARLAADGLFLGGQPRERGFGVGGEHALALDVGGELLEPQVELGDAVLGALLFAFEVLLRDVEPVQRGAGARLGLAQFRQRGGGKRLALGGFGLRAGALGDHAHAGVLGVFGLAHLGLRRGPAQVIERGLLLAHLHRHGAVADRLLGLLLEAVHLGGELADDVFQAQQIGFGGFQPQLRLVPARMQAGDAGGFLQHAAALLGLGLDDLADAALMHQRRRARAGRGVGKQNLHVAGAHFAAVDAVGRAGLALDAARDVDLLLVVEGRGRGAVGIVDQDRDFGVVARRPRVGAGEDHLVHRGGAHGFVRGLAHHPAQRFDQIGFAAAVRPDHAGQSRLDQKIGRLDERLEAEAGAAASASCVKVHAGHRVSRRL